MAYLGKILLVTFSFYILHFQLSIPMSKSSAAGPSIGRVQTATASASKVKIKFKFKKGAQGWTAGFADLPVDEDRESLVFKHKKLPPYLDETRKAVFIAGYNESDDLFMFIKRQFTGLKPDTRYQVDFKIRIATDAPSGCIGAGGAPGESVYLKVGGSTEEPVAVVQDGWYRMNIDKGNQEMGGANASVIGHIGNSSRDCFNPRYEYKDFTTDATPVEVTSDKDGNLWLIIGTDSGYEARTAIYYTNIVVTLRES